MIPARSVRDWLDVVPPALVFVALVARVLMGGFPPDSLGEPLGAAAWAWAVAFAASCLGSLVCQIFRRSSATAVLVERGILLAAAGLSMTYAVALAGSSPRLVFLSAFVAAFSAWALRRYLSLASRIAAARELAASRQDREA